jgi:hypothetical protein
MLKRCFVILMLIVLSMAVTAPTLAVENFYSACAGLTLQDPTPSEDCRELMLSFPEPVVAQVEEDRFTLSNFSFWKVTHESPNLYDAPNGSVIGQMPAGFNFVHAVDNMDGWVKTNSGEWMSEVDLKFQQPSFFRGVQLLGGLDNSFGWVLGDLLTVPTPGASQSMDTGVFMPRYQRVNIFGEVELDGWKWYMVGPDQWIEQRSLAIAKPVERPEDVEGRWVAVDLYEQVLVAYENDTPVFATLIASGLPGWDTNEGVYEVWARVADDRMAGATGAPDAYALESVPWVMYFDGGISLHGTYWHDGFGYRRSHGCVNLSISDARFIFEWMESAPLNEKGELVNKVFVWASGEYRGSGPATK